MLALATVGALAGGCTEVDVDEPGRSIEAVLAAETDRWMAMQGVQGTALGLCDDEPCIVIFATDPAVREAIGEEFEGHRVDIRVTGEFRALDSIPSPTPDTMD